MTRIVILGGGFAGVSAAQELTKRLRRERRLSRPGAPVSGGIEVLLINRDNYFVFQPLLADIISGTIETTHVVVPLRRMLPAHAGRGRVTSRRSTSRRGRSGSGGG